MFSFSERSKKNLETAHPDLQKIFNEVIKIIDCTVVFGHRNKEQQELMVEQGYSKLHYPNSKHNKYPSLAVDVVPYPIDWENRERFVYLAGIVKGTAAQLGIELTWGGDWDGDNDLKDQKWIDLPHYELKSVEPITT